MIEVEEIVIRTVNHLALSTSLLSRLSQLQLLLGEKKETLFSLRIS